MNRRQRHLGRELALTWLYQLDLGHQSPEEVTANIPDDIEGIEEEGLLFARQLFQGVQEEHTRIDEILQKYARGWTLPRMAVIDRNVLRLAMFELLDLPDIPACVSVDEAIELVKRYSTPESSKFVNGILGAFLRGEHGPDTHA